ncbi:MAG: M55 family metallopeptidase, partial [Methanocella sp.]
VSGDDKACGEAKALLPQVVTVETKTGWGRHTALSLAPQAARELIRNWVRETLNWLGTEGRALSAPYRLEPPFELTLRFTSADLADQRSFDGQRSVRLDALTAVYRGEKLLEVFDRAFR